MDTTVFSELFHYLDSTDFKHAKKVETRPKKVCIVCMTKRAFQMIAASGSSTTVQLEEAARETQVGANTKCTTTCI
jgi:hypothetical protein